MIIAMPTTGKLEINQPKYGSTYQNEVAKAGYYSNFLTKYHIKTEATATTRAGITPLSLP